MHAAALRIELRIPDSQSLKEKRRVLRPIIEGLRTRVSVSVAEIDRHDSWQRATLGVALVAPGATKLERLIDVVHDYVDGQDLVEIVLFETAYMEEPA
jgi:uncharacterized protein YlxP (DUF503 family)